MTIDTNELDFFNLLIEQFGSEKAAKEFLDVGCSFKEWKLQAKKYRRKLEKYQSEECQGAILENQWQSINYHEMSSEEFYSLGHSPLEILSECVLGDIVSYPPPEILKVIANQFQYYMLRQGAVSLENAFFGDSRGRGIYAKRALSQSQKNQMYEKFEAYSNSQHGGEKSQEQILVELASIPPDPSLEIYEDGPLNPFQIFANETEEWVESFLRDYRRWKNQFSK